MKYLLSVGLLLFSSVAFSQAASAPTGLEYVCLPAPFKANDKYLGTYILYGEDANCRWIYYTCQSLTGDKDVNVLLTGSRSVSLVTLAGRVATIEKSATPEKAAKTAWARYITVPLTDPGLAACIQSAKASLALPKPPASSPTP